MQRIKIKYKTIVFLSAYLNQIDLSLDRSRWTNLNDLRAYLKKRILPDKIVSYVSNICNLKINNLKLVYFIGEYTNIKKLKIVIERIMFKKIYLSKDEIYFLCKQLIKFDEIIKSNKKVHKLEIEKLRIEIAKFNTNILKYRLNFRDLERVRKIDHYLKNDKIEVISINEFAPKDFLLHTHQ